MGVTTSVMVRVDAAADSGTVLLVERAADPSAENAPKLAKTELGTIKAVEGGVYGVAAAADTEVQGLEGITGASVLDVAEKLNDAVAAGVIHCNGAPLVQPAQPAG